MTFLPDVSVMSTVAHRGQTYLYGNQRLEAAMVAMFQRMRTKCSKSKVAALAFFDQGHDEYRTLYRKAQVYLPTGSMYESKTRNIPLDMFIEDANTKNSKHCWFTQAADLIAYAAFLKVKAARKELTDWQVENDLGNLYSFIPIEKINSRVSYAPPRDGILRMI
jgi:hypothetical protein